MWSWLWLGVAMVVLTTAATALYSTYSESRRAEAAFATVEARSVRTNGTFDPSDIASLPEVAQRYFRHAIADGAPLDTTVRLEMEGIFLLGDGSDVRGFEMTARQILAPPIEFVWIPRMRSGVMDISGSDALVAGEAWTRFRMNGLLPLVSAGGSPDLRRSALSRAAMEGIWAPASLLPSNGVAWRQTGNNTASLAFPTGIEPVELTLDEVGRVTKISTMRWSDANPEKVFRLQPFGGTTGSERRFGAFTIPAEIKVGNYHGTDDYLPFFQVRITSAEYL